MLRRTDTPLREVGGLRFANPPYRGLDSAVAAGAKARRVGKAKRAHARLSNDIHWR
jgi:hypothetical protein